MADTLYKTIDDIARTKTLLDQTERIPGRDNLGDFKITFQNLQESLTTTVPAGTVIESAAISTPSGFLPAQGGSYSRTTYAVLYNAVTLDKGNVSISIATPGEVTLAAHGLSTGHNIELTTTGALPTGLSVNTNYFVIYKDANTFYLATSLTNALAGTKINTSGSQSGTHSLRFTPYGIDTGANFKVPDRRAVVGVGAGSQTINTRAKTAVLGLVEEDQMQRITGQLGRLNHNTVLPGSGMVTVSSPITGAVQGTVGTFNYLIDFDSANSPNARTGTTTRENRIGMNYYIKY